MVDFIKGSIKGSTKKIHKILNNKNLEFIAEVNTKTGELSNRSKATYKGLTFIHVKPKKHINHEIVEIEGSLHKFWNDGKHNFNDFGINELYQVTEELYQEFEIEPKQILLKRVEIGVNINPNASTNKVLSSCLLHKTTELKSTYVCGEGNYKQAKYRDKVIKLYDKKIQYRTKYPNLVDEILRFEIKYLSMRPLFKKGIYTLHDLIDTDSLILGNLLITEWENILMSDFKAIHAKHEYFYKYSNVNFWLGLGRSNFKYHRNKLKEIINTSLHSSKKEIKRIIGLKADALMKTDHIAI